MRLLVIIAMIAVPLLTSCGGKQAERPLRGEFGHIRERPITVDSYSSASTCTKARRLSASECLRGFKLAMAKHPIFAEKFGQVGVCEDIYGVGSCAANADAQGIFASPRPVGFLVCLPEPDGCANLVFAPIYENAEWGKFTGVDGGHLRQERGGRFTVSGRVGRYPII